MTEQGKHRQRGSRNIPAGLKKDWRRLAEKMRDAGWTFEEGKGYPKAYAPDGVTATTFPKTPKVHSRGLENAKATFRRWCRQNGVDPGI